MECLVDDGLTRAIGVANFSLKQVEELLAFCRIKPCINQVELHPLLAQRKLVGTCLRKGVVCVGYSPLGSQRAPGNAEVLGHPVVAQVAAEAGKTPAQVGKATSASARKCPAAATTKMAMMSQNGRQSFASSSEPAAPSAPRRAEQPPPQPLCAACRWRRTLRACCLTQHSRGPMTRQS